MNLQLIGSGFRRALEGTAGAPLLHTPEDVVDVIGNCFEYEARGVLLYAENLTERFFDLSSGEAGDILQKFRNYYIRLAVVVPQGGTAQSSKFRDMVAEEKQGRDFRIFEDRDSAVAWLTGE